MQFLDEVTISVTAGKGGDGCCSFRREKYIPFGGPDGGNGGSGGSVYLVSTNKLNNLGKFRNNTKFKAENGKNGFGSNMTGACGQDLFIEVPMGTVVISKSTDEVIYDLIADGDQVLVARGGDSGAGNAVFKTSTNRAPRKFSLGKPGDHIELKLELKLLADVGLLGAPNAGKSTLISCISSAKPKIANYPFTTLTPNLGVVRAEDGYSFVVADIPGLIEGASSGHGLGIQFLKHLSRTSVLLHLLDVSSSDLAKIKADLDMINNEVSLYSRQLAERARILVLTKIDSVLTEDLEDIIKELKATTDFNIHAISAVTNNGLNELIRLITSYVKQQ